MINKVNIYTKVCLPCVMKKQEWHDFQRSVWNAGYEINMIRTTYDKELHKEATKLWGDEGYIAFVLMPNSEVETLEGAKKMFEDIRNKLTQAGKTKPVRKGKKNVQRLRKTKRSIRVDSVEDSPSEVEVETKTR